VTSPSKFHGYAYDAVWTIALAVDSIIADRRGRYDAADFRGERRLHAALNRTDFVGVTVGTQLLAADSAILPAFMDAERHFEESICGRNSTTVLTGRREIWQAR